MRLPTSEDRNNVDKIGSAENPGLRTGTLTRAQHRERLLPNYKGRVNLLEEFLNYLYPSEPEPTTVTEVLPPVRDRALPTELRVLCREIETLCRNSRCSSVAAPAVSALIDYLTLRAKLIELQS
jgi:hypothetical protein